MTDSDGGGGGREPFSEPFNQASIYESPDPKRVWAEPEEPKVSKGLLVGLAAVGLLVLVGIVAFVATSGDEETAAPTTSIETGLGQDPVARFHERTDGFFDESTPVEQREAIGQAVCDAVDRSSDPRTVRQQFQATFPEADVRLLFDASANAWCPEHAALLARS